MATIDGYSLGFVSAGGRQESGVRIANLELQGNQWKWTMSLEGEAPREMKTNASGHGLFFRNRDGTWSQEAGTSQFGNPSTRNISTMRARIRRHYAWGS